MASRSRNIEFGAWTQEEYERLFDIPLLNIIVIQYYIGSTALPVPPIQVPL